MELEPHQYGYPKTYEKWRRHPPTYGSLILDNLMLLAVTAFYCAAAAFACHLMRLTAFGLVFVGFWFGHFVAEFSRIRTVPVAWSVLSQVLDPTRVEQAIAERRFD
jgi:hypothetical protein